MHYYFVKEKVLVKEIKLICVSTKDQVVDKGFKYRQANEVLKNAWCTRSALELEGEC